MAKKHQVKVSSKRGRTQSNRKYRRQELASLRGAVRIGAGMSRIGVFRPRRRSR